MLMSNVNGYPRNPIFLIRGIHQGSPLSPIILLIVAQVFSNNLNLSHDITGLLNNGIDLLLYIFADDTEIFLRATLQSAN